MFNFNWFFAMFRQSYRDFNPSIVTRQHPYVVDPIATQPFQINVYGWYDSDITALVQAQSAQVQDNIMNRLSVLQKTSNSGLSDAELLKVLIPRYCQSFSERERFMNYLKENNPELFKAVTEDVTNREEVKNDVNTSEEVTTE